MERTTEQNSHYSNLERMSVKEILLGINEQDKLVPSLIEKIIPSIEKVVEQIVPKLKNGGRLFYIGAGTSGRLGIVDASECPPTFGVDFETVIGIIAGGDSAIRKAVEFAEDSETQAWKDLQAYSINAKDFLIGIAASGTTPYVIGGLKMANEHNIATACIVCNNNSPIAKVAQFPIEIVVGPEFLTGSTRMKSGTAQKLILNMISTSVMIQLGFVKGNKMVDMKLSNNKLVNRGVIMLMEELNIDETKAQELLNKFGSVRNAIDHFTKNPNS